jgi:hypothetical protein
LELSILWNILIRFCKWFRCTLLDADWTLAWLISIRHDKSFPCQHFE